MDQKGLKYMKKGVSEPKIPVFCAIGKIRTLLESSRKLAITWKNPDSFEIIRKIGSHLENQDSFEIIRKIGSHLEKSGQF